MYDWNRSSPSLNALRPGIASSEGAASIAPGRPGRGVEVVDETLRDGLQGASCIQPSIAHQVDLLHAMTRVGVDVVSIGMPAAGAQGAEHSSLLCREIVRERLSLKPTAAARTVVADVQSIARVADRAGAPIEVYAFIGSSPIRHFVEGWDLGFLSRAVAASAREATAAGLPFCLVTEDATRSHPDTLRALYRAAIDAGAGRICLCDTTGHATPWGAEELVGFVRSELASMGASHVGLDWHGHDDRGLALSNALGAASAGVDRVHGTGLGVGERVGNTPIELLIDNLALLGVRPRLPEAQLIAYCELVASALARPISVDHPIAGARICGARSALRPYRDPPRALDDVGTPPPRASRPSASAVR
jgi:2-isopropylmalate synthase